MEIHTGYSYNELIIKFKIYVDECAGDVRRADH